ncbi:hypothetical protein SHKM778_62700 [Streptomyces sp. KM77-8]|uniref:Peptidase M24 domain-containing protein n=1 Tax=Streptomyces haneummycinicus TaxID=3074435 RepID=A0AAT9HRJ5_9ACTN
MLQRGWQRGGAGVPPRQRALPRRRRPEGAVLLLGRTEDLLVCVGPPDDRSPRAAPTKPCASTPSPASAAPWAAASAAAATPRSQPPAWPSPRAPTPRPRGTPPHRHAPPRHPRHRPRLRLTGIGCAVEQLRVVKDEEEISCLRIGAEIADQALGELLESILVGRTERHLALELERRLVDHGADGPAFPTSVATGPHAGRPGHRPTDRRVEEGDFLSVCLGATYRGYRCEIGRTFVIGTAPADWQIELYDLVFSAQRAGRESSSPAQPAATWTARPARCWTPRGTPRPFPNSPATVWDWKSTRTLN